MIELKVENGEGDYNVNGSTLEVITEMTIVMTKFLITLSNNFNEDFALDSWLEMNRTAIKAFTEFNSRGTKDE